ncbi:MAG: YhfC family intramembrane metalloprotease [Lachnospiraceae bacterium]|nr:YhfC family intramembrane metalloprotease [Lachnospiraceae bacterium]MCM1256229.1 YhfC family intramembrane metalloprotease [Roseburia sp.]
MQIPNTALFMCLLTAACGIIFPTILVFVWKKKTKQPLKPVVVGAAAFFLSAVVLKAIPAYFLLSPDNPVGRAILGNDYLYALTAGILAGLFEETGRFIAFKLPLKESKDRITALSYGIGHGGFEVMYIFLSLGLSYFAYGLMINSGQFDLLLAQAGENARQMEALQALPQTIASMSPLYLFMSLLERTSAVMFHIACSILVFCAARDKKKLWLYPLAILLHLLLDLIPGLYQSGIINNMYLVEGILFLFAALLLKGCYELVYKKCK